MDTWGLFMSHWKNTWNPVLINKNYNYSPVRFRHHTYQKNKIPDFFLNFFFKNLVNIMSLIKPAKIIEYLFLLNSCLLLMISFPKMEEWFGIFRKAKMVILPCIPSPSSSKQASRFRKGHEFYWWIKTSQMVDQF